MGCIWLDRTFRPGQGEQRVERLDPRRVARREMAQGVALALSTPIGVGGERDPRSGAGVAEGICPD